MCLLHTVVKHVWNPAATNAKLLHEVVAILQSHKIVQIVDNEDFDNENEVEELCPEHKGKAIDAFCVLCCCICHAKHHRSCQRVWRDVLRTCS